MNASARSRTRLFEFNDSAWAPPALRETLVESLTRTLAWGHVLDGLVEPFAEFLDAAGTSEVLDLCSGAGGPAAVLVAELARHGRAAPRFLLTDLEPRVEAWRLLRDEHPGGAIDFVAEPVDATAVPVALGRDRVRLIVNALHHFSPERVGAMLCAAAADAPGVFVAESLVREPLQVLAMAPAGLPALLANPVLAAERRVAKAALTWLTPIALAAAAWDVGVSALRCYGEDELRELVAPAGKSMRWTFGGYRYAGFGRGAYFYGVRERPSRRTRGYVASGDSRPSRRAARSNTAQAPQRAQSTSLP